MKWSADSLGPVLALGGRGKSIFSFPHPSPSPTPLPPGSHSSPKTGQRLHMALGPWYITLYISGRPKHVFRPAGQLKTTWLVARTTCRPHPPPTPLMPACGKKTDSLISVWVGGNSSLSHLPHCTPPHGPPIGLLMPRTVARAPNRTANATESCARPAPRGTVRDVFWRVGEPNQGAHAVPLPHWSGTVWARIGAPSSLVMLPVFAGCPYFRDT